MENNIPHPDAEEKEKLRMKMFGERHIGYDRPRSGQILVAPSKERNTGIKTNKTIPVLAETTRSELIAFRQKQGS
jgi:hypothetical protein